MKITMKKNTYLKPMARPILLNFESNLCTASNPEPDEYATESYKRQSSIFGNNDSNSIWE